MIFCEKCGATLKEGAQFCSSCGTATLTAAGEARPAKQPTTPAVPVVQTTSPTVLDRTDWFAICAFFLVLISTGLTTAAAVVYIDDPYDEIRLELSSYGIVLTIGITLAIISLRKKKSKLAIIACFIAGICLLIIIGILLLWMTS